MLLTYIQLNFKFCLENHELLPSKAIDILDESKSTQMKIKIQHSEVLHHLHNSLCKEFETKENKILRSGLIIEKNKHYQLSANFKVGSSVILLIEICPRQCILNCMSRHAGVSPNSLGVSRDFF